MSSKIKEKDFPYSVAPITSEAVFAEQKLKTLNDIFLDAFIDAKSLEEIESGMICWAEAWQKARLECESIELKEEIFDFIVYTLYEGLAGVNRRIAANLRNELRGKGNEI